LQSAFVRQPPLGLTHPQSGIGSRPVGSGAQVSPGGQVPPQVAANGSSPQGRGGSVVVVVLPGGGQCPCTHARNASAQAAAPARAVAAQPSRHESRSGAGGQLRAQAFACAMTPWAHVASS